MQAQHWLIDLIRQVFGWIDSVIYNFINTLYQLFAYISRMTLLSEDTFQDFSQRIYMILGIIMLFKIAFSLISYLANPDDLTDSKKGIGGIIQRIIVSLAILTFIPTIFNVAYQLQVIVVEDNVIANFMLGDLVEDENAPTIIGDSGKNIAFDILSAFYYMEPTVKNQLCKDNNGEWKENCDFSGWDDSNGWFFWEGDDRGGSDLFNQILNDPESSNYKSIDAYLNYMNEQVGSNGNADGTGYYGMHYMLIISTLAGIATAWIFLGFCFDIAIRAVKLSALQLIAPIPVLSYIDLKKGDEIFKKWVKECVSTYIGLFTRLIVIFFVIYLCREISENGIQFISIKNDQLSLDPLPTQDGYTLIAKAFIYIGLLFFAKDAPKLIGEIFGIKSGGFTLNPLAKLRSTPVISAVAGMTAARVAGGVTAAANEQGGNKLRAFTGGWSAGAESVRGKLKMSGGDGKSQQVLRTGMKAGYKDATGSEMSTLSPSKMIFKKGAREDVQRLKETRKIPLINAKNRLSEKLEESNATRQALITQFQNERDAKKRQQLKQRIDVVGEERSKMNKAMGKLDKELNIVNDQIKDLNKTYNLDESTNEQLEKITKRFNDVGLDDEKLVSTYYEVSPEYEQVLNNADINTSNGSTSNGTRPRKGPKNRQ